VIVQSVHKVVTALKLVSQNLMDCVIQDTPVDLEVQLQLLQQEELETCKEPVVFAQLEDIVNKVQSTLQDVLQEPTILTKDKMMLQIV
jgi:hypothetical protein